MARAGIAPNQNFTLAGATFIIHTRLEDNKWQVRNVLTGAWNAYPESELLQLYQDRELVFEVAALDEVANSQKLNILLKRSLATFSGNLVQKAEKILKYLIRLDCHRNNSAPIQSLAPKSLQQFIVAAAAEFEDQVPPSPSTLHRAYSRWIAGGRDIRAAVPKHEKRGNRLPRLPAEVLRVVKSKMVEVLTCREKRTSRHVLSAVETELSALNKHRDSSHQLPIPSIRTVTRMIAKIPRYELAVMQHGKKFADVEYRSTGRGPITTRPLEQVEIDHTPIDCIAVDENTGLPLGRPWITSILDRYTKCCIGFSIDFGGPSTRSIMRAFKNAVLPKTYVKEKYPTIENEWPCYGLWSLLVADNGKDFLSDEVMRVSSDLGFDILYGPPRMGSFKGAIERFQRTLNEQNMHSAAGTTLSKYLDLKDYNPRTTAVITLGTLREEIHRWIIDVYHQDVHGSPGFIPIHRWIQGMKMMTVPLPAARVDLDRVVGLHRYGRVWHYGMDFLKLKYNSSELQDLRCQFGKKISLEHVVDFDDLGMIYVIHPVRKTYIAVPATYPHVRTGRFSKRQFGRHLLSANRLCLSTPRVCPMCLRNQEFCRRLWDLALYTSCHIHRVEMVDTCPKCRSQICWNRKSVSWCRCGGDLRGADCRVASEHSLIVSEMLSAIYLHEEPRSMGALLGVAEHVGALDLDLLLHGLLFMGCLSAATGSTMRELRSTNLQEALKITDSAGRCLENWPLSLHHLFRMLYERRPGIQSNPHKDMFGKNYHAWLKLMNDPHLSFVRKEYESFIGNYWTEPIRPQSHLARSGCTKQSLITATQAAKLFGVSAMSVVFIAVTNLDGEFRVTTAHKQRAFS